MKREMKPVLRRFGPPTQRRCHLASSFVLLNKSPGLCHRRMQLKGKSAVPMKIGYDRAGPRLARDKRPRRTRGLRTGSNGRSSQGFSCRERRKPGSAGSRTGAIGVGSLLAGPALEHLSYHPHHKGKLRLSRFCQTEKVAHAGESLLSRLCDGK